MLRHLACADGVPIASEVSGTGPALVLVHGAGSARWGFDPLRPLLEDSFTVIAIDRRGRGDSGDGDRPYSIDQEFADVAAVVVDAGEGALLFGHSYGGLVAAGAAGLLPALDDLVLYEPPMGGVLATQDWIERYETKLDGGNRPAAVRDFMRDVGGYTEGEIDALQETSAWVGRLAAAGTVPRELRAERAFALESLKLEQLTSRCLMLVGSQSPNWALRSTEAYAASMAGVRVSRLEGQGHGAMLAAPELVARRLREAL